MSTDDRDDPGADTAMFRAFVDEGHQPAPAAPATNRTVVVIAVAAVVVVVVLVGILMAAG